MEKKSIGLNLKLIRERKNLTQTELGKVMGVSTPTISGWESGRVSIKPDAINRLCNVLGCHKEELLGLRYVGRASDLEKKKLIDMFDSLSEDNRHLLLVRARELQVIESQASITTLKVS